MKRVEVSIENDIEAVPATGDSIELHRLVDAFRSHQGKQRQQLPVVNKVVKGGS